MRLADLTLAVEINPETIAEINAGLAEIQEKHTQAMLSEAKDFVRGLLAEKIAINLLPAKDIADSPEEAHEPQAGMGGGIPETKTCKKCGVDKPLEEFHHNKNFKDGRYRTCKMCRRAANKKRYKENKTKNPIPSKAQEPEAETKLCQNCKKIKPITKFPFKDENSDERAPYCTPCYVQAKRKQSAARKGKTFTNIDDTLTW